MQQKRDVLMQQKRDDLMLQKRDVLMIQERDVSLQYIQVNSNGYIPTTILQRLDFQRFDFQRLYYLSINSITFQVLLLQK